MQCLFQDFAQEGANAYCQNPRGANTNPRGGCISMIEKANSKGGDRGITPGPPEINPDVWYMHMY